MGDEKLRFLGHVTGTITAAAGTVACGRAIMVEYQVALDSNAGYEVAVKPVASTTGTASKNNCAAVLTDNGSVRFYRPAGVGSGTWVLARRLYNGVTGATGGASNRYVLAKYG